MVHAVTGRAESAEEFGELMGRMFGPAPGAEKLRPYEPRPTDVIITPYGKCGTTWLQQTFHQLRTGGDMEFDDISRVVPWIETALSLGLDINAEQKAEPRGFKSHLSYDALPEGARYVVSLRNPKDAFISMFRFMEGWFIEPDTVPMEHFYEGWITPGPQGSNYWSHLLSWWRQRDNPNVLLLTYEHMIETPEHHVRMLADFCGIPLDDDLLALTLERSSLAYMLEHKDKFADPMMRALSEERCGFAPGSDSAKVRKGGVGGHKKELSAEIGERIDTAWSEQVAPETGLADYAALDAEVRRRNGG
ncbi:sulfotransferase domain-containing protein [Parasphingopyxis sp.]|uniref:sulfotransferase domain-containing protein n=1 Tax=Parasphingopyxis sp. TaxID=1920299 RepID=UPI0026027EDA|nr:sulfotransferase domain-containing protein [Parasphingopyxis sp.]